ncbi:MAG TPA: bifunctional phosphoribosyl-AMP cyclohydrolase/phosphoribosyl-ATP diphosphatase HisIE [Polyangiales bacterium]|nr:bifunctional phosphoribosyl-AMP cyclohydrolase/phosphoribosyl-ATP diphosphatase HisIE [Polyangiales bacterium]
MLRLAMQLSELKWDAAGLVSVVVQDQDSGEVRMLAHANAEAIEATLRTGYAHFFSRSRGALWRKGETSGHGLRVFEIWVDCDADALVYLARAEGPSCHTGRETCFFRKLEADGAVRDVAEQHAQSALPRLWSELDARRRSTATKSYTKSLLEAGPQKICAKIEEEAGELSRAIQSETPERVISESADVLYHTLVGLLARGVTLKDLEAELARRFAMSGHAEKASRNA